MAGYHWGWAWPTIDSYPGEVHTSNTLMNSPDLYSQLSYSRINDDNDGKVTQWKHMGTVPSTLNTGGGAESIDPQGHHVRCSGRGRAGGGGGGG